MLSGVKEQLMDLQDMAQPGSQAWHPPNFHLECIFISYTGYIYSNNIYVLYLV